MKLRPTELEFLSAWAREEKAPNPYVLPAHQLQAAHGVKGVSLIRLIKGWARSEARRDEDIFDLADTVAFFNMSNRMASGLDIIPNHEYHRWDR